MASIWKGFLSFGLVNIPVELRTAVREDHIRFRLLHAQDLSPVRYERICEAGGEPVPWNEIVKGYEYEEGRYVVLTDDDFKAAALKSSKALEILDFVKQEEIDPRFFETPYFLVPAKGGEKGYALLREAVRESRSVGIGKITIRQSQHLAGVKAVGEALVLEMMRFAGELVDPSEFTFPKADLVGAKERALARQLVETLAGPFKPEKYTDDYREELMNLIHAKMKGKKVEPAQPKREESGGAIINLMERLQASLKQGAAKTGPKPERKPTAQRESKPSRRHRAKSA